MRITFFGGAGEVGRSCVLVEKGQKNIMLDCGIKLGEKTEYPLISDTELHRVDGIAVSHAHLDHSGYLPHVYGKLAKPDIYATKPTRDLMGVLLSDYYRIHAGEREQKRLFTQKNVDEVLQKSTIVEYNEPVKGDFGMTFHPAGHILGSAMIRLNEKGGILYTGDICMRKTRVLEGCERELRAETVLMETTYGGKDDVIPSYKESSSKLITSINETLDAGGHVIIPSFAVGRAQEILLILDDYMRSGALRKSKIYVEGMIGKALRIHRHNALYASEELKRRILMSEDDPFKAPSFHYPRSKSRKDVLDEPCIIVTTSGMLSGGPVLFYLDKLGHDPKNRMIFVGYQAPGTVGRRILDGERSMMVRGREITLRLGIEQVRISGHSDFNELLQFVRGIKGLKRVFLMHGEKTDLKGALEGKYEVIVPRLLESYGI